jgi:hypothetical protein
MELNKAFFKKYYPSIITIFIFFLFILQSNAFDWDYFFTTTEVERRSWLDFELPLWSYQFCGGSTRIGDPQSMGLSPIFIFNILFGSILGPKVIILISFVVALVYLIKTGQLMFKHLDFYTVQIISLSLLFSNFFISHLHNGHLSFVNHLLFIPYIYLLFKCLFSTPKKVDYLIGGGALFIIFSGGLYQSLVFFIFPMAIALILSVLFLIMIKSLNFENIKNLALFVSVSIVSSILSFYKTKSVFDYNNQFPRTIANKVSVETLSILQMFNDFLTPVFKFHYFPDFSTNRPWAIWEYSIFSFIPYIILFSIIYKLLKRPTADESCEDKRKSLTIILFIIATFFIFSSGEFSPFSPFSLMNKYITNDSVRVIGRFYFGLLFGLFLLSLYLFPKDIPSKMKTSLFSGILTLIIINIFLPYPTYSFQSLLNRLSTDFNHNSNITNYTFVPYRIPLRSFMYYETRKSSSIINCYQPLQREARISNEFNFPKELFLKTFPIIHSSIESCRKQSFLSQNKIHLDPSCDENTCIDINAKNIYDKYFQFQYDIKRKKYCL